LWNVANGVEEALITLHLRDRVPCEATALEAHEAHEAFGLHTFEVICICARFT